MTRGQNSAQRLRWKEELKQLLAEDRDLLKGLIQQVVQQVLEERWTKRSGRKRTSGRGSAGIPVRLLQPDADDAGGQTRAASATGPAGAVPDRGVRALPAQ